LYNLTDPSYEPEAAIFPSGENDIVWTGPECPLNYAKF